MELTKKTLCYGQLSLLFVFWIPWKFWRQLVRKYASVAFLVYV